MAVPIRGPVRSRTSILIMLVLLVSVLSPLGLFVTPALAHDDDGPDKDRGMEEGKVKVQKGTNSFELVSNANGTSDHERLILKVDSKDGLDISLTLTHTEDRIQTQISVTFSFLCLVGLKDGEQTKDISCYGNNKERSVRPFSNMTFNEPYYSNYTSDKGRIHKLELSTKDGKFRLKMELTGDFDPTANGTARPEPISMLVKFHKFDFRKDDKYLGLKMEINSNVIIKVEKDLPGHDGTHGKFVQTPGPQDNKDEELGSMFLAVNDLATVDGEQKDVVTTIKSNDEGGEHVAVAYPRGETIQQDIQLGIEPSRIKLSGEPVMFAAGIGAAIAVFVLTDKRILALLSRMKK